MKTVNKKLLNVCTPILNQLIHRLLLETVDTSLAKDIDEAYSSGPVPDSHRIPFSPHD